MEEEDTHAVLVRQLRPQEISKKPENSKVDITPKEWQRHHIPKSTHMDSGTKLGLPKEEENFPQNIRNSEHAMHCLTRGKKGINKHDNGTNVTPPNSLEQVTNQKISVTPFRQEAIYTKGEQPK